MNTSIGFFDFFITCVSFCSFFTNRIFPYIQNEKPITIGNSVLKFIKIYSLKLIPSLNASVPAKITISNPKAMKIISLDDSIFNYLFDSIVFFQSTNKLVPQTFYLNKNLT